jgi:uncharacterized protein YecA (UPF0149 family)
MSQDISNLKKQKELFNDCLDSIGILDHINADQVVKLIEDEDKLHHKDTPEGYPIVINMLFGLLENINDSDQLIEAYNSLIKHVSKKNKNDIFSSSESLDQVADKLQGSSFSTYELPDISVLYNKAIRATRKIVDEETIEVWNNFFREIYRTHSLIKDLYRAYANKATAHLQMGDELLFEKFTNIALEINPNYDYAQMQKEKFNNGEFDDLIQLAKLMQMQKNIKNRRSLKHLDPNEVSNWPEAKILQKLQEFGIKVSKDEFINEAKKAVFSDSITKNLFYPRYQGPDDYNQDFCILATDALKQKWCPDLFLADDISSFLNLLLEKLWFAELDECKTIYQEEFREKLRIFINKGSEFFQTWKEYQLEYLKGCDKLSRVLISLYMTDSEENIQEYSRKLYEQTKNSIFLLPEALAESQEDVANTKAFKVIKQQLPLSAQPYMNLAYAFSTINEAEKEENYLIKALNIVKKREAEKQYRLKDEPQSIFNEYCWVYENLIQFYQRHDDNFQVGKYQKKLENLQTRKKELSLSEGVKETNDDPNFTELISKIEEEKQLKELESDPAYIYYNYFKQFGINLVTKEKTKSHLVYHFRDSNQKKLGRNDPCPCGSGKKFKKCCLI